MSASQLVAKALALMLIVSACTPSITRPTGDRYALRISDNVEKHRFDVALMSHDNRPICVSIENWPNASGQFTVEKDDTFVRMGGDILPAKSKMLSAYCPGGCGEHRVEPKAELRGFISYEAFGDEGKLSAGSSKELIFPVSPYYCRRAK